MPDLSYAQFRRLSEEAAYHPPDPEAESGRADAGFSVKAVGPQAGQRAASSFMVGGESQFVRNPPTPEDLMSYTEQNREALSADAAHLGGWFPPSSEERGELDVSTAFPRTGPGLHAAMVQAVRNKQWGVGEVDSKSEYVRTRPTVWPESFPR